MRIRKTYQGVNPELLYNEVKDFVLKQGLSTGEAKLEAYSMPGDTSSFISRGTLTFTVNSGGAEKVGLRVHVVGSVKTETKLMLDIDERLFPPEQVAALQEDLDFIFGSYEPEPE